MAYKTSDTYGSGLWVYLCDQTNIDFTSIPSTDSNTVKTVEDYINANFTFTRSFGREGQSLTLDSTKEEQVLEASECDLGEIDRSGKTLVAYKGNIFTIRDENVIQRIANLTGGKYETEAWTSTPVVGEAIQTNAAKGEILWIANKNGDNTIVTSITVKVAWSPIVLNTAYTVQVDNGRLGRLGQTYITILTAQTGAITVDYTYVPAAKYRIGVSGNRKSKKYTILKCVSCATKPDAGGTAVSDYFYIVKAYLDTAVEITFPKMSEAFKPVPMSFMEATGGDFVANFATLN